MPADVEVLSMQVTEVVGHELLGLMQNLRGGLLGEGHSWVAETSTPSVQQVHSSRMTHCNKIRRMNFSD